ncbi:hypothetical protein R3P38DRAFT_3147655 [Favolaschia claudopus]|uniref:MYND-type domain-containing protein n=1 Tax=Favolaschia claudopus TaxID=2862362 RepID=A0AAV9Z2F8_9AGAR
MHPDLRVSNLDRLPLARRLLAKSLIADTSLTLLTQLSNSMREASHRPARIKEFLPVFYILLDPARIPELEALDILDPNTYGNLWGGIISLDCLSLSRLSFSIFPDLWPRISAWSLFLVTHEGFLSGVFGSEQTRRASLQIMEFCGYMAQNAANKASILSSPTSRVLAMHSWACFSPTNIPKHQHSHRLIYNIIVEGKFGWDDIPERLAGSVSDLARLIMRQCEHIVPLKSAQSNVDLNCDKRHLLVIAFALVVHLDGIDDEQAHEFPLLAALVRRGFVKTVTITARAVSTGNVPCSSHRTPNELPYCLTFLREVFRISKGNREIRMALRCEVLPTLLELSRREQHRSLAENSTVRGLVDALTQCTVFYHILGDLSKYLAEIDDRIDEYLSKLPVDYQDGDLANSWRTLQKAVAERMYYRTVFDSEKSPSLGVCGNAECGIIADKKKLRRCSSCRGVMYCSRQCQALDWQSRHRSSCALEEASCRNLRLNYTHQEYGFLLHLVHYDYLRERLFIAAQHIQGWADKPGAWFFTQFDYRRFPAKVATFSGKEQSLGALRGSGFMDVRLITLPYGLNGSRDLGMIKVSRESSVVPDKLKDIAVRMVSESLTNRQLSDECKAAMELEGLTMMTWDASTPEVFY